MLAQRRLEDGRVLTVYAELTGTAAIAVNLARGSARCAVHNARWHGHPCPPSFRCGIGIARDEQCEWVDVELEEFDHDGGYDLYFQFPTVEAALVAYHAMEAGQEEPEGWTRAAPPRFRRRPEGDPAKEFVRP